MILKTFVQVPKHKLLRWFAVATSLLGPSFIGPFSLVVAPAFAVWAVTAAHRTNDRTELAMAVITLVLILAISGFFWAGMHPTSISTVVGS
jgi:NO-binding membrane sensor protein with MHYT domain